MTDIEYEPRWCIGGNEQLEAFLTFLFQMLFLFVQKLCFNLNIIIIDIQAKTMTPGSWPSYHWFKIVLRLWTHTWIFFFFLHFLLNSLEKVRLSSCRSPGNACDMGGFHRGMEHSCVFQLKGFSCHFLLWNDSFPPRGSARWWSVFGSWRLRDSCEYLYCVVRQPLGLMAHFIIFMHRQGENYLNGSEMHVKLLNEPTFLWHPHTNNKETAVSWGTSVEISLTNRSISLSDVFRYSG